MPLEEMMEKHEVALMIVRLTLSGVEEAVKCYRKQIEAGAYFLHELPRHAPWKTKCLRDLPSDPRVFHVQGSMCRFEILLSSQETEYWRTVVYLGPSFSSDEHYCSHSCFGHRRADWKTETPLSSYRASLCWCLGWSSTTVLPLLVQIVWTFTIVAMCGLCALVNRPQYHDVVTVVQESETEDPQLVAEPGVGRNHGEAMGKS